MQRPSSKTLVSWKRPGYASFPTIHTTLLMMALVTFLMSSRNWQRVPACWEKLSTKYNFHGPDQRSKQVNCALQSLPKGLRFLRVVPTLESPMVMGLIGIHDLDALRHYTGYTYCPLCGKERQNEGTVVNHLRTTHYRLGLVCDKCFGCPSVMSDSLCRHGHQDCWQYSVLLGWVCPTDPPSKPRVHTRE